MQGPAAHYVVDKDPKLFYFPRDLRRLALGLALNVTLFFTVTRFLAMKLTVFFLRLAMMLGSFQSIYVRSLRRSRLL